MIPEITVGDRLRIAREKAGHRDQTQFAKLIGVGRSTAFRYENDQIDKPKKIVVNAWSLATGVPVEWLLYGTVDKPDSGDAQPQKAAVAGGARPEGFEPPTF